MMANGSCRWWVVLALVQGFAAPACRSAFPEKSVRATTAPAHATAPATGPTLMADVAPIAALAHDGTYLWVGSARGLRRVRLATRESEWIATRAGFAARQVTALAPDGEGTLWVGSETGVGIIEETPTGPRYRAIAALPGVTRIVPVAATPARDDAWIGTETGLSRIAGGAITPVEIARGDVVTFLDPDDDGSSVWVGLRARGLFRVDSADSSLLTTALTAVGPGFAGNLDFIDPIGTTLLPNGTRIAYGRAQAGGTRIVMLSLSGPVLMAPEPDLPIQALIQRSSPASPTDADADAGAAADGDFIAGPEDAPVRFQLFQSERGAVLPAGAIRFLPARKSPTGARLAARPVGATGLRSITAAVRGRRENDGVFVGSRSSGTARLVGPDTVPLPSSELALGATGLSVTCVTPDRCFVATGTGTGWNWEAGAAGGAIAPLPAALVGGRLMTLAGDQTGDATFSVSGDPGKILRVARLSADGTRFDPVAQVPIDLDGAALATCAAVSPTGASLWIALRERARDGTEVGRGAIELQLSTLRVVHHRIYGRNETAPRDALPIAGDVRAIRFEKPSDATAEGAIWFCTTTGIFRHHAGELVRWGENNGLESERCQDLAVARDGTVWAATAAGAVRFERNTWRPVAGWPTRHDGETLPARALVERGADSWAGTPNGLWPLVGSQPAWNRRSGLLDEDVLALAVDRFARVWSLGSAGVTLIDPTTPAAPARVN